MIIACAIELVASQRDNSEHINVRGAVNEILNEIQDLEQKLNNVSSKPKVGEKCETYDSSCEDELVCVAIPHPTTSLGSYCVGDVLAEIYFEAWEEIYRNYQQESKSVLGEKCEGFDETTGKPFPGCEDGLFCEPTLVQAFLEREIIVFPLQV
eukprot:CAMPEP_0194166684 /NCGR_PEP_ID=MMETSP0154-20130528/2220_1 /TAXON_ID=1049557 /ORGANISM="Thalassiothrix antarctica, Strain L6-D1" /LENGTH=152 /DNA_ID=CAMNT_0038877421 /DNA_START=62 /DNA_END=521 /DNA_ORIENTATION=-